jgi:Domain of unknown function (DUF4403)
VLGATDENLVQTEEARATRTVFPRLHVGYLLRFIFLLSSFAGLNCEAYSQIPQHTVQVLPHTVQVPLLLSSLPPIKSSIPVTVVDMDLSRLQSIVLGKVPRVVEGQRFPGGLQNPWFHFERQSATLTLRSGKLALDATYRGLSQAKEGWRGLAVECRLEPVFLSVSVRIKPQLKTSEQNGFLSSRSTEGQNWFFSSSSTEVEISLAPGSDTHCGIGGLFDVGGEIDKKLSDRSAEIKSAIDAQRFPVPIEALKILLRGPIEIPASGNVRLCLYPEIDEVRLASLKGIPLRCQRSSFCNAIFVADEPESLVPVDARFVISATPILTVRTTPCSSDPPLETRLASLDSLLEPGDRVSFEGPDTTPTAGPFRVMADIDMDYAPAAEAARQALTPIRGQWRGADFSIQPSSFQISDSQGQMLAAVTLQGSLAGTVFFWGTPTPNGTTVSLQNLHLADESRVALATVDSALPDLVSRLFETELKNSFILDLEPLVAPLREMTGKTIRLPGASATFGAFSISLNRVRAHRGRLLASALLTGTVDIRISIPTR